MVMRHEGKWNKKLIAMTICVGAFLSGCGRQADTVTDYGSSQNTSSAISSTSSPEGDTGTTPIVSSGDWRKLSDQLGGTRLTCEKYFSVKNIPAKITVDYELNDSDTLPAWRVHKITEDRVHEKDIVQNFFGDTASEVRGEIGRDETAEKVYDLCTDVFLENAENFDPAGIKPARIAWIDEDTYFLHTWEGKYHNTEYQLSVAWFSETKEKRIAFGPKCWGDAINLSSCETIEEVSKDSVDFTIHNEDLKPFWDTVKGLENRCQTEDREIISTLDIFLADTLCLKQPSETLYPKVQYGDMANLVYESREYKMSDPGEPPIELFFCHFADEWKQDLREYELNGYLSRISEDLARQNYCMKDKNTGSFYVTDHGVIAGYASIFYDYEECITDQTYLLSFKNAMDSLEDNFCRELDPAKVTGSDVEIGSIILGYYAFPLSGKTDEAVLLPVWEGWIRSDQGRYSIGEIILNAVDGTLVINYNN